LCKKANSCVKNAHFATKRRLFWYIIGLFWRWLPFVFNYLDGSFKHFRALCGGVVPQRLFESGVASSGTGDFQRVQRRNQARARVTGFIYEARRFGVVQLVDSLSGDGFDSVFPDEGRMRVCSGEAGNGVGVQRQGETVGDLAPLVRAAVQLGRERRSI
jgi:hypothetical protein